MRIWHVIGAILFLTTSPAMAKEAVSTWVITQMTGDVRVVRSGMQPASAQLRASLSPGDVVATGANGRAMLTKGDDYVVVAPASRLVLPKEQQQTGFTRLFQQVGTMLYKVKRTGVPHFEVQTPMLAAVVKGTTFTVIVDQKGAAVQVTEGVVEVSALTGDARRLVEGGVAVYIGRERPQEILEVRPGDMSPAEPGAGVDSVQVNGSGEVSLAAISDLTGGLVREAPVTTVASVVPVGNAPAIAAAVSPLSPTLVPANAADVVEAVVNVADTGTIAVDPVVQIVNPVVQIVNPVVQIVDPVIQIVDPVVQIADTVVPVVVQPVVDVLPIVTQPLTVAIETAPTIICGLLCGR